MQRNITCLGLKRRSGGILWPGAGEAKTGAAVHASWKGGGPGGLNLVLDSTRF